MRPFCLFLFSMAFALCLPHPAAAQNVSVTVRTTDLPKDGFIGGSTEFMYPVMRGIPNADSSAYDSVYISSRVIDALKDLKLNYLRFPGGTISQFYHFWEPNGYGTTDFDLDCRPGFLNIPGFRQKVAVDGAYPKNMIENYLELHRQLEAAQGNTIRTLYVINIMNHFFTGDFLAINEILDAMIDTYGASLGPLLDVNPSFLSDQQVEEVVEIMTQIYNDALIGQIRTFLFDQDDFQLRMGENIAGINRMVEQGISIAGVELGNENYAFTMLQDDDLSDIPYDCTTPDSVVQQLGPITLPLRAYMQAIIKYGILTSMYDALIDQLFALPTGIVANSTQFNVDPLSINTFAINEVKTERYRYFEIWNKFIGTLNFYDGVIPHIYMKSQPQCDVLGSITPDSLELYGEGYIDFYMDEVLDYQLSRILDETGNKPLWITEWNINTANMYGNTFLHGSYILQFMNTLNRIHDQYNIDILNIHNLAAWRYNQFALLRTDEDSTGFLVNKQSLYHPYRLMGELQAAGHPPAESDFSAWLGNALQPAPDHYFYSHYDASDTALIVLFINQAKDPVTLPLDGVKFSIDAGGSLMTDLRAASYDMDYIDAESFLSSDEGCSGYPAYFDNYVHITSPGTSPAVELPGYSLGRLTLQLDIATGLFDRSELQFDIVPNPASGAFRMVCSRTGQTLNVSIFDLAGKLRASASVTANASVDISGLEDGIYFVHISEFGQGSSNAQGVRKLVVSNGGADQE